MRTVLPVDLEGEALWVVVRLLGKKVDNHHHGFLGSTFIKRIAYFGVSLVTFEPPSVMRAVYPH